MENLSTPDPKLQITRNEETQLQALNFEVANGTDEEFSLWKLFIAPLFDFDMDLPPKSLGKTSTVFLGEVGLSITKTMSGLLRRDVKTIAQSGLDNISIVQYHSGQHRLRTEAGETDIGPGDFVLFDLTKTCEIRVTDHSNSNLLFSRKLFSSQGIDIEKIHGAVLHHGDAMNAMLSAYLISLTERVLHLSVADAARVANATTSLFAAGFSGVSKAQTAQVARNQGVTLVAIRNFIDDHLSSPDLGVDLLLQKFPVSRSVLYKMFEPLGGVQSYINKRRLGRVFQSLVAPELSHQTITDIAAQWGFTKTSTFNRLFKDTFSMTPKELRSNAKDATTANSNLKADEDTYLQFMASLAAKAKPYLK